MPCLRVLTPSVSSANRWFCEAEIGYKNCTDRNSFCTWNAIIGPEQKRTNSFAFPAKTLVAARRISQAALCLMNEIAGGFALAKHAEGRLKKTE
jgi:hypothetical protein